MAVETSATMAATDRSISPEMIRSAMAKAIIAFSVKLKLASDRFQGSRKYGEASALAANTATATTTSSASQERSARCAREVSRSGMARAAAARGVRVATVMRRLLRRI